MKSNLKIGISAKWITQNQALPLMIPSESADSDLQRKTLDVNGYACELDGLILQGGVAVHPSFYGGNSAGECEKTLHL